LFRRLGNEKDLTQRSETGLGNAKQKPQQIWYCCIHTQQGSRSKGQPATHTSDMAGIENIIPTHSIKIPWQSISAQVSRIAALIQRQEMEADY